MKLRFTERADKDYAGLPVAIRKAFAKQLRFLLVNLRHPFFPSFRILERVSKMGL